MAILTRDAVTARDFVQERDDCCILFGKPGVDASTGCLAAVEAPGGSFAIRVVPVGLVVPWVSLLGGELPHSGLRAASACPSRCDPVLPGASVSSWPVGAAD